MLFDYKGISQNGENVKGTIEAIDESDAKTKLKQQSIIYESVKASKGGGALSGLSLFDNKAVSDKTLAKLTGEWATYLGSGMTITSAVKLSAMQYGNDKKIAPFLSSIITLVGEGKSFYSALEGQKELTLPDYFKQTVKVAEDKGFLKETLLEISEFLLQKNQISSQIKSALAYPIFIVSVSLMLLVFMFTVVVPKITGVFETVGQDLPTITVVVIGISDFMVAYKIHILSIMLIILLLYQYLYVRNEDFKYTVHRFALSVPIIGKIVQTSELSRFLYVGALLVKSGVPMAQALKLSGDTFTNLVLRRIFQDAVVKVIEGQRFSAALSKEPLLDKSFVQTIFLGEESGQIATVFQTLSGLFRQENKDKTALLMSLVEPALIVFVGGMIGVVVVAMLLPIVSISMG